MDHAVEVPGRQVDGKGAVQCVLGSTTGADPEPVALSLCYQIARKKLLNLKIAEHRGHIAPMLTFNTVC